MHRWLCPQGPNQRWSLDFAADALTDGRRFRILVVLDDFPRECVCLVADIAVGRTRGSRADDEHRAPWCPPAAVRQRQRHRTDQQYDPDLVSGQQGRLALHCAGQAAAERIRRELHRPVRDECLNETLFTSLRQARAVLAAWQRDYNEVRPHSAIGNQTPIARAFASGQACLT